MMAELAEFAGDFSTVIAARAEKLGVIESNSTSTYFERWSSVFELHFAYAAADNQQMLDAHDTKYKITSATVGEMWPKAVFPLPGFCERPFSFAELEERIELTQRTTEIVETCRDGFHELSQGKPVAMVVWMRSDASSRVQAASAAGVGYSETVLRCAAYAAVGKPWHFPVPRGLDYVFIRS